MSLNESLRGLKRMAWLKPRRLNLLANTLRMSRVEKRAIIFDEMHSPESVFVLLSGVARITCGDRRGRRVLVMMIAPGMIPALPTAVSGISYSFRCEAATACQIGTVTLVEFIGIALGIASADFKHMAASYSGRWDPVPLRGSNFMGFTLEERVALILREFRDNFGIRDQHGARLRVRAPQQDIAELAGASRPRVNECITGFERKRLIVRDGRWLILKRGRLERFLAQGHSPASRSVD